MVEAGYLGQLESFAHSDHGGAITVASVVPNGRFW